VSAGFLDIPFFPQFSREKLVQIVFHLRLPMISNPEPVNAEAPGTGTNTNTGTSAKPGGSSSSGVAVSEVGWGAPLLSICPNFPFMKSEMANTLISGGGDSDVDTRRLIGMFCRHLNAVPFPIR
jgi:hypothetical protein